MLLPVATSLVSCTWLQAVLCSGDGKPGIQTRCPARQCCGAHTRLTYSSANSAAMSAVRLSLCRPQAAALQCAVPVLMADHDRNSQAEDGNLHLQGLNQAVLIVVHLCKHLESVKHAQQSVVFKWDSQGASPSGHHQLVVGLPEADETQENSPSCTCTCKRHQKKSSVSVVRYSSCFYVVSNPTSGV